MPWSMDEYPNAMNNLPAAVREKAIDLANALYGRRGDEGRAIRIGIAQAKRWAARHPSMGACAGPGTISSP